jgi:leucyl aminopeptidase
MPGREPARIVVVDPSRPLSAVDAAVAVTTVDRAWEGRAPLRELAAALGVGTADPIRALVDNPRAPAIALPFGGRGPDWIVCVGIDAKLDGPVAHRQAGMRAAAAVGRPKSMAVVAEQPSANALAEGVVIGCFEPSDDLGIPSPAEPASDPDHAVTVGRAVNWCRQLVEHPSSALMPQRFAAIAADMAQQLDLQCRTWSPEELRDERFGGILAVAQGGDHPPCMVDLRVGNGAGPELVLVGKGVTCDSGGLQIKTDEHHWLKADMAGAGAVLAAAWAIAILGLEIDLRVLIPLVENMPGPGAYRTGDVIVHRDGTTTEQVHTDVEGRLVLADVLRYAAESEPAAIVDVATLTDRTALGPELWALMSNDDPLAGSLIAAGGAAGDPGWRLPLWPGYRALMTSRRAARATIARLGSVGVAGTIVGGLYLADFVGNTPWAHMDIAGACFHTHGHEPWPPGATGVGTAALVRFAEAWATRTTETSDQEHRR